MSAILTFLLANKKDVAYAAAFLTLIWTGWYMRGVYDDHRKLADLEDAQRQMIATELKIHEQATAYEASRAASQASLATLKQQLKAAYAKDPSRPACPIGVDIVRLINQ